MKDDVPMRTKGQKTVSGMLEKCEVTPVIFVKRRYGMNDTKNTDGDSLHWIKASLVGN